MCYSTPPYWLTLNPEEGIEGTRFPASQLMLPLNSLIVGEIFSV